MGQELVKRLALEDVDEFMKLQDIAGERVWRRRCMARLNLLHDLQDQFVLEHFSLTAKLYEQARCRQGKREVLLFARFLSYF